MDPNETYRQFLVEREEARQSYLRGHKEAYRFHLENAVNQATDLTEWLKNDGFPPEWQIVAAETIG